MESLASPERVHSCEVVCLKGGGGSGTQNFVYQKWPDKISPIVNFVFFQCDHFGLEEGGPGGGGGLNPPPCGKKIKHRPGVNHKGKELTGRDTQCDLLMLSLLLRQIWSLHYKGDPTGYPAVSLLVPSCRDTLGTRPGLCTNCRSVSWTRP